MSPIITFPLHSAVQEEVPLPAHWLVLPLLAWLAGTALQLQQALLWPLWCYAGMAILGGGGWMASIWLLRRWPVQRANAVCFVVKFAGVGVLAFACCGLRATAFGGNALPPALEGQDIEVTAHIAEMPQRGSDGLRLRLDIEHAWRADGSVVRVPPRAQVGWYFGQWADAEALPPSADIRAGQRWTMTLRLKAPHGNHNPFGFDYELWLWSQDVQATGYVRTSAGKNGAVQAPQWLQDTWRAPLEQLRQKVRDAIVQYLLPGQEQAQGQDDAVQGTADAQTLARVRNAGVVAALVTGDQRAIDRSDWQIFRDTGVAHLVSISGLHITMFAWLAATVMGWCWRRSGRLCLWWPAPHAALCGGVLLAGAYALFSGWGLPAQRTLLMLCTVAALRLTGKQWPWPVVWLLTCALVVAYDPWAMLQAGFWLSFIAVGILFAGGMSPGAPDGARGLGGRAWQALRRMTHEQAVITLALTPLTLLLFHQISVVGFLANLLAIPWVTFLVTPLAMLGILVPPLWSVAAGCVQVMDVVLRWLAALPAATLVLPAAPWGLGLVAVLAGIWMALRLPWSLRSMGAAPLLCALLWQAPRPAQGDFEILVLDVGQGSAIVVRTARHSLLFDAGPRLGRATDAGERMVVPLLHALGEPLDMLMLSHDDSDHSGGARAVLAAYPQSAVMGSYIQEETLAGRAYRRCEAGQRWEWDGVHLEVLQPLDADYVPDGLAKKDSANGMSCVLRIGNGAQSALLTGDIGMAQEQRLVQVYGAARKHSDSGAVLRADVLLLAHHGSKSSNSAAFLQAVQPRFAVAQTGYRNRYGHPAEAVVQRLQQQDITLLNSPDCGAVWWKSRVPEQVRCERKAQQRYWHYRPQ